MRLEDMDAVIEDMGRLFGRATCVAGCAAGDGIAVCSTCLGKQTLSRLRQWRESAVEGWVMRWSAGPWEVHPDAEPDDHDGRGLLLTTPREER